MQHYCRSADNMIVNVQFRKNEADYRPVRRKRINLAVAAMITSHARMRLWNQLHLLGTRVIYHDTDSVIYEHRPDAYNVPEGKYLGEWLCETNGVPIVKFASTGPKCYTYVTADGKEVCKVKGITLSHHNKQLVNFESMKKLVLKQGLDSISTLNQAFVWQRGKGTVPGAMYTGRVEKKLRVTYTKGVVDPDTTMVYPLGGAPQHYPDRCQMWN